MIALFLALFTALFFSNIEAKEKESESDSGPHPSLASMDQNSPQPVRIENLAVDVDYVPSYGFPQNLVGTVNIPLVYSKGVTQPLELRYMALRIEGVIDSIASCYGIDSLLIYPDSSLVFFREKLPAGTRDTLILYFHNRKDFRSDYFIKRKYYGLGAWCPVPANIENRFTVNVTVRTPAGLAAVAGGELLDQRQIGQNRVEYSWRQKTPGDYTPVMVIDSFTVSSFESEGNGVSIYHCQRPEQKIAASADWLLGALGKFKGWFGPIPYSKVNLVELDYHLTVYFSVPGLIGVPEGHYGGTVQGFLDSSAVNLRKIQSHELAHQWWAEKVYPPENRSIMEAWAEYCALKDIGEGKYYYLDQYRRQVLQMFRLDPGMLSPLVEPGQNTTKYYRKGPWVLHMLENELGEQAFLGVLKSYQEQYSYKDHSLIDFFNLIASVTGKNMDWFMREWFYKAGIPSLTLRQEMLVNSAQFIIRQNKEIYNITLPLEVYHSGSQEVVEFRHELNSWEDTLGFAFQAVDSLLIDPGQTILMEQVFEPHFAVAPFGDSPAIQGNYSVRFYVDPARPLVPLLFYRTDQAEWDSLGLAIPVDTSGYGGFEIPLQAPGRRVSYYVKFTDSKANTYCSPTNAPQDCHGFRTTSPPPTEDMVFISFAEYQEPGVKLDLAPFPDFTQGVVGLNMRSRQVFGVLYGVGSVAPQIDPLNRLYIAYNRYSNAVDIVDLDTWKKTASYPLPPESRVDEYSYVPHCRSTYDQKRKNYYYYDGGLYKINVENLIIENLKHLADNTSFLPSKIGYNQDLDRLLIKKSNVLQVLDLQGLNIEEEIRFGTDKILPFLDASGKVETLEYIGDMVLNDWPLKPYFTNFRLRYNRYTSRSDMTLLDSLVTATLPYGSDILSPILANETTVKRVKGTSIFFGTLLQNKGNRFVWDVSSSNIPFVFSDNYFSVMPVSYWVDQETGKPVGLFPSVGNDALALVDLKGQTIIDNAFSPFSTSVYDYLRFPKLIGIVSPEAEVLATGDLNRDSRVDIFDLISLLSCLNDGAAYSAAHDLNRDGKNNVFDLLSLLKMLNN